MTAASLSFPPARSFTLRVTMLSDWHVGAGTGRPGSVDRLVARDVDGLPYIPAKTLRGVWRDACVQVARGLDDGKVGPWSGLVEVLFGNPAGLVVRPARLLASLRERLRHDTSFREVLTFVQARAQVGQAFQPDTSSQVRLVEMARAKAILEAECELGLAGDDPIRPAAAALLLAATRLVERIGGLRRRGAGRCSIEVTGVDCAAAIRYLHENAQVPQRTSAQDEPPRPRSDDPPRPWELEAATLRPSGWVRLPIVVHVRGPIAASYRKAGNATLTLDHIPGTFLLPHVSRILGADVRQAIVRGDFCVLPATLEIEGERSRPAPFALQHPHGGKGFAEPKRLVNLLLGDGANGQLEPLRDGYLGAGDLPRWASVPRLLAEHPSAEGGYCLEAIAPSDGDAPIRLRTELRLRRELVDRFGSANAAWWRQLEGTISLGRSRHDDYGEVLLELLPPTEPAAVVGAEGDLFVWLLSDTLLRGASLRPAPDREALRQELEERLGVRLEHRPGVSECSRLRRLETWNGSWGMPRPSLLAFQGGSCFVFRVVGSVAAEKLAEVEASGIGERNAEGFGQVRFNDPLLTRKPAEWTAEAPTEPRNARGRQRGRHRDDNRQRGTPGQALQQGEPGYELACLLERELWGERIRRLALALGADGHHRTERLGWRIEPVGDTHHSHPPLGQLAALRGVLAALRKPEDAATVLDWLRRLEEHAQRQKEWPIRSFESVRRLVADVNQVWGVYGSKRWPTLTAGGRERLRVELWSLAVRALFDASVRAHQRACESGLPQQAMMAAPEQEEANHDA